MAQLFKILLAYKTYALAGATIGAWVALLLISVAIRTWMDGEWSGGHEQELEEFLNSYEEV